MQHAIATSFGEAHADVAWPTLPGNLRAELTLACVSCGYQLKLSARREPADFDAMVGDFLRRHSGDNCRRQGPTP